jgi:sugar lactone lactonase YvrE
MYFVLRTHRVSQRHGRDTRQLDAHRRRILRRQAHGVDIDPDGGLSNRRAWADLGGGVPDGICLDADNAVWYGDVPNKRCVRVREGGEVLQTIHLDRGCFACMLGGPDRRTLFILAAEWRGIEAVDDAIASRTGQVLTVRAPAPRQVAVRGGSLAAIRSAGIRRLRLGRRESKSRSGA